MELKLEHFRLGLKHRTFPETCRCLNIVTQTNIRLCLSVKCLDVLRIVSFSQLAFMKRISEFVQTQITCCEVPVDDNVVAIVL
jgi:hypothetical protein